MTNLKQLTLTLALLITAATGAWAEEATKYNVTFKANGNTKTVENVTLPHTFKCDFSSENGELDLIIQELYGLSGGFCEIETPTSSGSENVTGGLDGNSQFITISAPFEGTATVTGIYCDKNTEEDFNYSLEITCAESPIEVNLNDTKTTASFTMPASDLTVNYTLKRDMTVDVAGEMADRIRIQMVGNAFQAVDATQMDPVVKDNLDEASPVTLAETTDYTLQLQKQNETDATVWTDVTALSVGNFRYKITGAGNYSGVAYSEEFQLFQGYEIDVPAGEFVTYFKDEALYVEDTDAKLYTITAVSDETATAEQLNIAAANTPLLVKNNATVTKTILLIPTEQTADDVTPYSGFTGTLVDAEVPASTDEQNNYALNGNEFIWVKDAVSIAANHAWLQVPASGAQQARTLTIVFSDATAIGAVSKTGTDNNSWYDLNGRKLDKKPTRKGVYIQNGRKVVIK